MFEFLTAGPNLPFSVALTVMILIAVLEGVSVVLGLGLSSILDTLLPDLNIDADGAAAGQASGLTGFLNWLHVGKVPALILLILFLTAFGLIGLALQSLTERLLGHYLPAYAASIPAVLLALPVLRYAGRGLARVMPGDETEAVSEASFIGRVATIILGTAKADSPAQAKLRDQHGQSHYVMVIPDEEGAAFPAGTRVLLVRQEGHVFFAVVNEYVDLIDQ